MRGAWLIVVTLAACHAEEAAIKDAPVRVDPLVAANCTSCHGADLIAQQRLTPAQWTRVITKMAGWGSPISAESIPALSAKLAEASGPYAPALISSQAADAQTDVRDDGPFERGDAARGADVFASLCASCHGPDARGGVGVNLADRILLGHARDVAHVVRRGRYGMPAFANTTDQQLADLIAHLRSL